MPYVYHFLYVDGSGLPSLAETVTSRCDHVALPYSNASTNPPQAGARMPSGACRDFI